MPLGFMQSTRSWIPAPPAPLYLTHMDTALMTKVITPNHTVREGHSALPGDDARATILCQVCVSLIAHIKPILHVQTQQKVHHLGTATSSA